MQSKFNDHRNLRNKLLVKYCPSVSLQDLKIYYSTIPESEISQINHYFDIMIHFSQYIGLPNINHFTNDLILTNYYHNFLQSFFLDFYQKNQFTNNLTHYVLTQLSTHDEIFDNDLSFLDIIDIKTYIYLFSDFSIPFPYPLLNHFLHIIFNEEQTDNSNNPLLDYIITSISKDYNFISQLPFHSFQQILYHFTSYFDYTTIGIFVDRFLCEDIVDISSIYNISIKFLSQNILIHDQNLTTSGFFYFYILYSLFSILVKLVIEYNIDNIISFKNNLTNIPTNCSFSNFETFKFNIISFLLTFDYQNNYSNFMPNFRNYILQIII
jgi:hypothetical protein